MEEHVLGITKFVNQFLGPLALSLLHAQYITFVGTVSIFVLLGNLLGVFPFFASPTGNVSVPFACAIVTFLYFNWQGVRQHGVLHYLLTIAGSPKKKISDWALSLLKLSAPRLVFSPSPSAFGPIFSPAT